MVLVIRQGEGRGRGGFGGCQVVVGGELRGMALEMVVGGAGGGEEREKRDIHGGEQGFLWLPYRKEKTREGGKKRRKKKKERETIAFDEKVANLKEVYAKKGCRM